MSCFLRRNSFEVGSAHRAYQRADMRGRCAAAAAQKTRAARNVFHLRGEVFGRKVENRSSVDNFGHTAVGIENHGDLHAFAEPRKKILHLKRPEPAV
jgi:hypothetical protein